MDVQSYSVSGGLLTSESGDVLSAILFNPSPNQFKLILQLSLTEEPRKVQSVLRDLVIHNWMESCR